MNNTQVQGWIQCLLQSRASDLQRQKPSVNFKFLFTVTYGLVIDHRQASVMRLIFKYLDQCNYSPENVYLL